MIKNILIIDKFLCFFALETGSLIISWLSLCALIIVELIINYSLVKTLTRCKMGEKPESQNGTDIIEDLKVDETSCFETSSTLLLSLLAVFLLALIVFCLLCIKGTKERNHRFIKPLMIWEGISTVTSVISIVSNPLNGLVLSILSAYMFVTLYSLYTKMREQNEVDAQPAQTVDLCELNLKDLKS